MLLSDPGSGAGTLLLSRGILWEWMARSFCVGKGSFDSLSRISPTVSFEDGTSLVTVTPSREEAPSPGAERCRSQAACAEWTVRKNSNGRIAVRTKTLI